MACAMCCGRRCKTPQLRDGFLRSTLRGTISIWHLPIKNKKKSSSSRSFTVARCTRKTPKRLLQIPKRLVGTGYVTLRRCTLKPVVCAHFGCNAHLWLFVVGGPSQCSAVWWRGRAARRRCRGVWTICWSQEEVVPTEPPCPVFYLNYAFSDTSCHLPHPE